jgi:hypothetical protein
VEGHPARPWSYEGDAPGTSGSITWYSAADLDHIARQYVRAKNIDFSFSGTQARFRVPRERDRDVMARGSCSSRMGKPVLSVEIGWDGYVRKHAIAVAVCEVGTSESAP